VIADYAQDQLLFLKPPPGSRELQTTQFVFGRGSLVTPLDVAEAPDASGRLYVTELGVISDIKLLTPAASS
jgi:hypothetical protein